MEGKQVKIFSSELRNSPGYTETHDAQRDMAVKQMEAQVNELLARYPTATVGWYQTSASGSHGSFTQLTAVVSFKVPVEDLAEELGGTLSEMLQRKGP